MIRDGLNGPPDAHRYGLKFEVIEEAKMSRITCIT